MNGKLRTLGLVTPLLLAAVSIDCSTSSSNTPNENTPPAGNDAGPDAAPSGNDTLSGPVVIGAGIAGARVVYELKKAGVTNVTLVAPEVAAGANAPNTGLTTTVPLPNGGMVDVGATLFPDTYELLDVARELGLQLDPFSTTLAIVRNGKPVVIDQANGLTLYNLFSQEELPPAKAAALQSEIARLAGAGFNHRDGRLYASETRTLENYLVEFTGETPAKYLSVIPQILGGQDPKTASAGFQQTLYMMTAPKIWTTPQMQTLPLKMIEASGAKVELASVEKIEQTSGGVTIEAARSSGEHVRWVTTAPVIVATPAAVAAKLVTDAGPEEHALLDNPMRTVFAVSIALTPGWTRPADLKDTTYGGVPDVERGSGVVVGWALDFRSPTGDERTVGITLSQNAADQAAVAAAIHEADKYLPGLESHVAVATAVANPVHAPSLTPAFYKAVDTYWKWIDQTSTRRILLAGAGANQYGMDGASFSAKLASEIVKKKMQ